MTRSLTITSQFYEEAANYLASHKEIVFSKKCYLYLPSNSRRKNEEGLIMSFERTASFCVGIGSIAFGICASDLNAAQAATFDFSVNLGAITQASGSFSYDDSQNGPRPHR